MSRALPIAAAGEVATGVALLAAPGAVVRLLFGAEATGLSILAARFAGVALIGLGVACWPARDGGGGRRGMLAYGVFATLYLTYLGIAGPAGPLLWPAVAAHGILCLLLARRGTGESTSA